MLDRKYSKAKICIEVIGVIAGIVTILSFINGLSPFESPKEPIITYFEINPETIVPGDRTTLIWSVSDATDVIITPGIGKVALSGSISVSPVESTTYTLTATNKAGENSVIRVVTVEENKLAHNSADIDNSNTGSYKLEASTPVLIEPEIEITYPSNKSIVNQNDRVIGTAKNVPDESHIWILGYSYYTANYYPRSESESIPQNGEWSVPIEVGGDDESGQEFAIIVMLANTEADKKFKDYVINCNRNKNWPGIVEGEIPSGAKEYYRVIVTRK